MTPSARLSAAIEVMADIEASRRPAADALKAWGLAHRFAGSGDRAAIAGLVYDALRRKASAAWMMGEDTARAILFGALRLGRGLDADAITGLADGGRFAPAPLTAGERERLTSVSFEDAPPWVQGDYPEWLDESFARVFGDERAVEGAALASRAPLDLRVNSLKAQREDIIAELTDLDIDTARWSPDGLRISMVGQSRNPAVHAEPAYIKGRIEIQDEGSQLAALLAGAKPGEMVIDLCAGAGGKTLALAAAMGNSGQIFATDLDKRRLGPIHERIERAGVRNVQVRIPRGGDDPLADMAGQADLVVVDAPCTGTGTWRRNPDAKWRIRPGALEQRRKEQADILDRAVALAKPGGRVAYITCSVLAEENGDQVRACIERHPEISLVAPAETTEVLGERAFMFRHAVMMLEEGLQMTPRRTGTDGFFFAMLRRAG